MPGNNKKNQGFTLLEIVVVISIFSILVVLVTNVFMLVMRAQQQTAQRQSTASVLRGVTETIARQVRVSEIDYAAYGGAIAGSLPYQIVLNLRDQSGTAIQYLLDTADGGKIKVTNGANSAYLTDPALMKVIKLNFYISPSTDPFVDERCAGNTAPNGCLATIMCTVTDSASAQNGFCCCTNDIDCRTGYCDKSTTNGSGTLYNICKAGVGGVCRPKDQQPRVTIVIGFQSLGTKPELQKTIYLQTTASSRIYKR